MRPAYQADRCNAARRIDGLKMSFSLSDRPCDMVPEGEGRYGR